MDPQPTLGSTIAALLIKLLPHLHELAVTALLPMLAAWLLSKKKQADADGKNSLFLNVAAKVTGIVQSSVANGHHFKAAMLAASADGKITVEEAKQLRDAALRDAKEQLGPLGLAELSTVLGVAPVAVDSHLLGRIEAAVEAANIAAVAKGDSILKATGPALDNLPLARPTGP